MQDSKYCYPNSNVLINRLNIKNSKELFEAEKELTALRLRELQKKPIKGKFDFEHLLAIHQYIFQDVYSWAGQIRTVEIGKGNLFCTTQFISAYANTIFNKYYDECYREKNNIENFVKVFTANYADLNALHPFREGNGRAQREFARIVCLKCGYNFSLTHTTHKEMLEASILSFNKGDNFLLEDIFKKAITNIQKDKKLESNVIDILSNDDLTIALNNSYDYYDDEQKLDMYNEIYKEKIVKMEESLTDPSIEK